MIKNNFIAVNAQLVQNQQRYLDRFFFNLLTYFIWPSYDRDWIRYLMKISKAYVSAVNVSIYSR